MHDPSASRTALATAYLRAAHQIIDPGPRVLHDPIALPLLGPGAADRIWGSIEKYVSPAAKALRSHVVLRARYAEDRLESAIGRGVRQYILVGAGFDTFALRQPHWASGLSIIEVDHPDTQRLKRSKISRAAISIPANVVFAGIDFERESLREGLARVGVSRDKPTFFAWLGVTMYLTEAAIESTLRFMAAFPSASEAVITFLTHGAAQSAATHALARRVSAAGEPFISYFTPARFHAKLLAAGFSEVHFLTPERSSPYFPESDGSLPNPKHVGIASACV